MAKEDVHTYIGTETKETLKKLAEKGIQVVDRYPHPLMRFGTSVAGVVVGAVLIFYTMHLLQTDHHQGQTTKDRNTEIIARRVMLEELDRFKSEMVLAFKDAITSTIATKVPPEWVELQLKDHETRIRVLEGDDNG